jgi:hypothetical protein
MKTARTAILICLVSLFACGEQPQEAKENVMELALLSQVEGCDDLLQLLKDGAIREMEEKVDGNLQSVLDGSRCYSHYENPYGEGTMVADACADAGTYTPPPEDATPGNEATEYSETNNQVAGVDEADFIKNDGGTIYILAGGSFKIIDAWPAAESRVISGTPIEGEPTKLFVFDDKAVVYSSPARADDPYGYYGQGECTYGYDCDFTGDGRPVKITVLDISDRASPVLLREIRFSGSYINSRRIGGAVYTVIHFPEVSFPELRYWPEEDISFCPEDGIMKKMAITGLFERLKSQNREIIRSTAVTDWIPSVTDTVYAGGTPETRGNLLGSCDRVYKSGFEDGESLLTIAAFDMTGLDPVGLATIVGRPGAVYASAGALYVASRHNSGEGSGWYYGAEGTVMDVTTVYKFALRAEVPDALYAATGVVEGRVLNQFSMDEFDGYLRIATTTGHLPDAGATNTLSVLEDLEGSLSVVGQVDAIAPGEDIRSVRFDGARGFVVTFKKTDPLFVLNLQDPAAPRIEGELQIPGFSTYMQMLDDTHIISIGYDADDQGSFAWFQGIQLQIFDISKLESPTLSFKEVIGTRGSTSEAATNHLAFNYFAPRGLLAIPMVICEGGSGGSYGDTMTFSGLLVYRISLETGFEALGGVSHMDEAAPEDPYFSCSNWWTDSNSEVKRSIFMEDYVYSVAEDEIKIDAIESLGTDVAVVDLTD